MLPKILLNKKGQILPFVLIMVALIFFAAFTIADIGLVMAEKIRTQVAADAAALAGATEYARTKNSDMVLQLSFKGMLTYGVLYAAGIDPTRLYNRMYGPIDFWMVQVLLSAFTTLLDLIFKGLKAILKGGWKLGGWALRGVGKLGGKLQMKGKKVGKWFLKKAGKRAIWLQRMRRFLQRAGGGLWRVGRWVGGGLGWLGSKLGGPISVLNKWANLNRKVTYYFPSRNLAPNTYIHDLATEYAMMNYELSGGISRLDNIEPEYEVAVAPEEALFGLVSLVPVKRYLFKRADGEKWDYPYKLGVPVGTVGFGKNTFTRLDSGPAWAAFAGNVGAIALLVGLAYVWVQNVLPLVTQDLKSSFTDFKDLNKLAKTGKILGSIDAIAPLIEWTVAMITMSLGCYSLYADCYVVSANSISSLIPFYKKWYTNKKKPTGFSEMLFIDSMSRFIMLPPKEVFVRVIGAKVPLFYHISDKFRVSSYAIARAGRKEQLPQREVENAEKELPTFLKVLSWLGNFISGMFSGMQIGVSLINLDESIYYNYWVDMGLVKEKNE